MSTALDTSKTVPQNNKLFVNTLDENSHALKDCDQDSTPEPGVTCKLILLQALILAPMVFPRAILFFSLHKKNNISNSNLISKQWTRRAAQWNSHR